MTRMNPSGRRLASCGGAMVLVVALAALAHAQPADRGKSEKASPQGVTDLISVAGDGEIRGAVVKRFPDGSLDVAVQRDWLDAHAPEVAEVLGAEERRQTKAVMEALAKRLAAAIATLPESRTRTLGLLRREADRVDDWLAAAEAAGDRDAAARSADEGGGRSTDPSAGGQAGRIAIHAPADRAEAGDEGTAERAGRAAHRPLGLERAARGCRGAFGCRSHQGIEGTGDRSAVPATGARRSPSSPTAG